MGRRGANQTAVFFAALGTAACGFSTSMEMLIAARFVSRSVLMDSLPRVDTAKLGGLGGGGIFTTATCVELAKDSNRMRIDGITTGLSSAICIA